MNVKTLAKLAWANVAWKLWRRRHMGKILGQIGAMIKSRTTRNVTAGAVTGAAWAVSLIAWLHEAIPSWKADTTWDGIYIVVLTALGTAVTSRVANWLNPSKKTQTAPTDPPASDGGYARLGAIVMLAVFMLALGAGCAVNKAKFVEYVFDPATGAETGKTVFTQIGWTTWGSEQHSAQGNLDYSSADWALKVGNAAEGQKAGDALTTLQGLAQLGQILGPIAGNVATEAIKARTGAPTIGAIGTAATNVIGAVRQPVTTTDTAEGGAK